MKVDKINIVFAQDLTDPGRDGPEEFAQMRESGLFIFFLTLSFNRAISHGHEYRHTTNLRDGSQELVVA